MAGSSIISNNVSSSVIAHVGAVRGEVFILRAIGGLTLAKKGDPIYQDDIVSTKENAAALVYSESGGILTFSQSATVQFTPSLTQKINEDFTYSSLGLGQETALDELENFITDGKNIEAILEATAAKSPSDFEGPTGGLNTDSVIVWQRTADEIVPVSGFRASDQKGTSDFFGSTLGSSFNTADPLNVIESIDKEDELVDILQSNDDTLAITEDSPIVQASVSANDTTLSGGALSYALLSGSDAQHGTLVFNSDGTYSYIPDADFNGNDSFQYVVTDTALNVSEVQTVTINVAPLNDLPIADGESFIINEDNVLASQLLNNDSDIDGDNLSLNTTPISNVNNGSLVLNSNGTFTYTPNENFYGADSFVYEISDGHGGVAEATVNITVESVADTPLLNTDVYTVIEDGTLTTTLLNGVLINDSDGDGDTLTVNATPVMDVSHGVLTLSADGTFTYTPDANFNGVDSFIYEVSDGNGGTAQTTATITVNSAVDLATSSENEVVDEDNPLASTVSTGDSTTSGGALSYSLVSGPSNGVLSSAINATTGDYTYQPNSDYVGSDSFQYLVIDSASGESAIETVTITVNPVVDLSGVDDTLVVAYDTLTAGDVSLNDTTTSGGGDVNLVFSQLTDPVNGTLIFNSDGTYTYDPTGVGVLGDTDSFTYLVTDAASGESSTQTVNLTINPENTAPEGTDSSATIDEDSSYTLLVADFGFSDVVEGDTFNGVRIDTLPALGTLALAGIAVTVNQIIDAASIIAGDLVFSPADNGEGIPYSSFTFSVRDSAGSIDTVPNTFTLNVNPIVDLPVAENDTYQVIQDTPFTTTLANGVLLNDSDGDGDTLTVDTTPVSDVTGGVLTLNSDGTFTYTPNLDFNGTDSFVYEINDGTGNTTQATASITVDYVSNTIIGTEGADNLIGAALSDDDIYSGGVGDGSENIQGVAGTVAEAQIGHEGSGNDRLIFDADDTYSDNATGSSASGHLRIRDFTVGDVTTDTDADTLVLGDFLRAGDPTFDGTAADAVRFFHFVNDKLVYIDRSGELGVSGDSARDLVDGHYKGISAGASLFLEFKGIAFDATPLGETLNTEAQIQQLIDYGFLDFS